MPGGSHMKEEIPPAAGSRHKEFSDPLFVKIPKKKCIVMKIPSLKSDGPLVITTCVCVPMFTIYMCKCSIEPVKETNPLTFR